MNRNLIGEHVQEMVRAGLADGTIYHRTSILRRVERECGPLVGLTTEQLRGWLDRPLGDNARRTNISHLARFYRWAIIEDHATNDPTLRLSRPRVRRGLPRPIPTDDLTEALGQAVGEVRVMLALAAFCGLRCCEIAALDGGDVHDRRTPGLLVVHGKGAKIRVVPLHHVAGELLRCHGIPAAGPVFERGGVRLPAWRVSKLLRAHLVACGFGATAHQLRHWYATETYERSGGDLRMVQELLGHASPATTAVYTAWSQAKAADVVATLAA